ncbi:cupin domain-containing protein [Mycobacterium sp. CVI_P3]|uniref:Cupin domain-containing protein n=1 Tax=Mycobacterium pinniadriaticum TaxID=2994102 RepID=A0ABT3SI79_9MYCO|nr:cupin domain-containing protein [Mycobacterium pinniadriaticum]MCX2932310.1 cupin domain-containing protein [Mycobacterium pinniadriaticum]MCX2938833.1 cupin domain-containing protein [Mycobacterium pinniadriaticum]
MESISLSQLADEQLGVARSSNSGRAAHTVHGGHDHQLRQTLIALAGGRDLSEHHSPGETTLQVLRGRVRLSTADDAWEGGEGDLLVVPRDRHGLHAIDDAVILLTVLADS